MDMSKISDADLLRMLQTPEAPPNPAAGMSDDELKAALATTNAKAGPSGDLMTDIPRRVGTAAVDAAMGWLSPILGRGGVSIGPEGASIAPPPSPEERAQSLQGIRAGAFNKMGATEYVPETGAGRVTQSALAGALMAGHPAAMLAGAGAGAGAQVGAEAANRLGLPPEIPALAAGLLGGAAANRVGQIPFGPRPGAVKPETAEMAKMARDQYGVPVTGLQMSETPLVRKFDAMSAKFPFSPQTNQLRQQQDAFNAAINQSYGQSGNRVNARAINEAHDRIGPVFDNFAKGETINFKPPHAQALQDVVQNASMNVSSAELAPILRQVQNVISKVDPMRTMTGEQYLALTKKGSPLDTAMSNPNSNISVYAGQIRDVLDDALMGSVSPEKAAGLREARAQYKALKTVEPLTLRATDADSVAKTAEGDISPAALRARVNQVYKRVARDEPGTNALNDLANIGQRFLKDPRDSGTPLGNMVINPIGGGWGATASRLAVPLIDQTLGRLGRSDLYAERLIKAGTNPSSVVLKQPSLLARLLIADQASNSLSRGPNSR